MKKYRMVPFLILLFLCVPLFSEEKKSFYDEWYFGFGVGNPAGYNFLTGIFFDKIGLQFSGNAYSYDKENKKFGNYGGSIDLNYKLFESDFGIENDSKYNLFASWASIVVAKSKYGKDLEEDYLGIGLTTRWSIVYLQFGPKINFSGHGYEENNPMFKYGFIQMGVNILWF